MSLHKTIYIILITLLFISCSPQDEEQKDILEKRDIPSKISMLFITQPHCPSCKQLEETMRQEKPAQLIKKYFIKKTLYLGEKIPKHLVPPNGTPTVYFLGYKNELLIQPMVGEKDEASLIMFLEDALLEYKTLYHIDLTLKKEDSNETNNSV